MKHHQRIFQLLILLLPTQLTLHFWPSFAFIRGIRVDYLSPTLYFTDLVLWFLLAVWILEVRPSFRLSQKSYLSFLLIFIFAIFNTLFSALPLNTFIYWLRISELALFYVYVANQPNLKKLLRVPLSIAVMFTLTLAISQLYCQKTIGGILYWFGERAFTATTPSIAKFTLLGRQYLRPYATFPHPNTLAAFMLVSATILFPSFISLVAIAIVILTFSQNAWLAGLLLVTFFAKPRFLNKKILSLFIVISIFLPFLEISSLASRQPLSLQALKLFSQNPITGVGLGNFIPSVVNSFSSFSLQPVHNIFLLVLSEAGLVGLLITFFVLNTFSITPALFVVLLTGLFDHYWLTQHQTQLLFILVLGLSRPKLVK